MYYIISIKKDNSNITQYLKNGWILHNQENLWWINYKKQWMSKTTGVIFTLLKLHLTHWPLGYLIEILGRNFQTDFIDWWLRHLLWNCHDMNVIGLHWCSVNIGSGNGLVPSGNKPLPELMLTQICRHMASRLTSRVFSICSQILTLFTTE